MKIEIKMTPQEAAALIVKFIKNESEKVVVSHKIPKINREKIYNADKKTIINKSDNDDEIICLKVDLNKINQQEKSKLQSGLPLDNNEGYSISIDDMHYDELQSLPNLLKGIEK